MPTDCLSVFDRFVGLVLQRLRSNKLCICFVNDSYWPLCSAWSIWYSWCHNWKIRSTFSVADKLSLSCFYIWFPISEKIHISSHPYISSLSFQRWKILEFLSRAPCLPPHYSWHLFCFASDTSAMEKSTKAAICSAYGNLRLAWRLPPLNKDNFWKCSPWITFKRFLFHGKAVLRFWDIQFFIFQKSPSTSTAWRHNNISILDRIYFCWILGHLGQDIQEWTK